jgi:ATP-dependent Clp protease ATP-binding subunit ClpA
LEDSLEAKRLSPDSDALRALEEAVNASGDLGHNYVGTEHLVLGLLATQEQSLVTVFRKMGIDRETVRRKFLAMLGQARPSRSAPFDRTTVARLEELSSQMRDTIRQLAETVDKGEPTTELRERLRELCLRVFETIDPGSESTPGGHR